MKILYYDCFSGISGDMNLAAMIGLGVDPSFLLDELQKLHLDGYTISFVTDQRKGISGFRADVTLAGHGTHSHEHTHNHNHSPIIYTNLKPAGTGAQSHNHTHRAYADIKKLIYASTLTGQVKQLSIDIFQKVAEAEALIHGKPVDEVHFHEVGAVDSIIDIVGAAICIDYLKPDKIISSPVQLGGGFVQCAHGTFPVPAPATLEILKDKPVKIGAVQVETTTPTGAAIIAALATEFTDQPAFNIYRIAYGIGHRDNAIPNVLRVCLAEQAGTPNPIPSMMIECNIDDMNPELYEYVMEKLFDAGSDDVYFQPVIMKKTRPAIKICVLCQNQVAGKIENILLSETSTLGLRKYPVEKTMLKRDWKTVETKWGPVKVKRGYLNDKIVKSKPEYEDCLKIAIANKISITDVYKEITKTITWDTDSQ
jgi:pyridinium-3,5-bisthiocarboxylic acid mononucleotide nickel chelatase